MDISEEQVKQQLSTWQNAYGCEIWWEKTNQHCYPIFKTKTNNIGTVEKPDIAIKYHDKYYMCEVKNADKSSNVYDSFPQILRYASGDFEYYIDDELIEPCGYFVATQYSIAGHLFNPDVEVLVTYDQMSESRKKAIEHGQLPTDEYSMTEQFTRELWRMAAEYNIGVKIGAILSEKLNYEHSVAPMLQFKEGKKQGVTVWK